MPIRRTVLLSGSILVATLSIGCGRDWDAFDPRRAGPDPGAGGAGASSSSNGSTNGVGQSSSSTASAGGGATSSSSSSSSASGAGGSSPCSLSVQDDFNDGTLDTVTWEKFSSPEISVSETNGSLVFDLLPMSTEGVWGVVETKGLHDLSGCTVTAQVPEIQTATSDAYTNLALSTGPAWVEIVFFEGRLLFKSVIDDVHTEFATATYDPVQHAYWRIREMDGTTYWYTSPDGKQWNEQVSMPNPVPVEAMQVVVGTGTISAVAQSGGRARFDNVSVGP